MKHRDIRRILFALVGAIGLAIGLPVPVAAQPVPGACQDGTLPGGALSRICIPQAGWNGDLVVYAHGYVAAHEPLDIQHLVLPDGTNVPNLVQSLGYAFATTSYRQNGLAILEGVEDLTQLVEAFAGIAGQPAQKTYVAGVSEGGIIAALTIERAPHIFAGALSTCGPIGTFRGQINYVGDFRALFDFYYPNVIPGSAAEIPQVVMDRWEDIFVPAITALVNADPARALELIRVARAPIDPVDPSTIAETVINVLWYNVFGTNDAVGKLGGNPFDNRDRWYTGSGNDFVLNALVHRYDADNAALLAMIPYESSGILTRPMVTLHTTGDEVIPFGHQIIYAQRAQMQGSSSRFLPIPIGRYGHCQFTATEVLIGFLVLVWQP